MVRVRDLYLYPIKACRGIRVERAAIAERGFARDRRWMIVDETGLFVTQRGLPNLSLVRTALDLDALWLSAPGMDDLELPAAHEQGAELEVEVWRSRGRAVRHPEGSAWFSRYLGKPHHLVFMPDAHRRAVDPDYARAGDIVSFADAYPFLLVSQASLDELNRRLAERVTMDRFRPNIVVAGCEPFAEDGWSDLVIGGVRFRGPKRCSRCSVTTVDPATGVRGLEPLTTFREEGGKIWFGMNLIHDRLGEVSVGDAVEWL